MVKADKFLSLIKGYAWAFNSGQLKKITEDLGIPTLAGWDWEKEKIFRKRVNLQGEKEVILSLPSLCV